MGFFKKWFAKDFATKDDLINVFLREHNDLTIEINEIKNDLKKDICLLEDRLSIDIDKINKVLLTPQTVELWKTTDAIIDILNNNKKDLHYKKIYTIIKSYNLSQSDLSLQSLKSAMYNLKMSRKIEYGKEAGTFRKKRSI